MRYRNKVVLIIPALVLFLTGCGTSINGQANLIKNTVENLAGTKTNTQTAAQTNKPTANSTTPTPITTTAKVSENTPKYPAETLAPNTPVGPNFDWKQPTDGPYPVVNSNDKLWIDVSLTDQRIHIMNGNKTIYTMITSSGLDGADTESPTGTYYVEPERGTWFYAPQYKEGAEYWVSWKGHGEFLFHSVPMDENKQVIPEQAAKLGVKSSHGCFHLSLADSKWIYDNIPTGTKVVVHN